MMKADVIRAHEVEQGMFERNYTSFTLRCKRHRGFSLRMPALPACRLAHGGLSPPARQCGSCPWFASPSQHASAASCRPGSSSALGGELETERRYTDFAELHESVCAKNFSLLGLTPTELRGYFPEKSFFKNSQTIQQERKEARAAALVLLYSRLADGFGSVTLVFALHCCDSR